jgi:ParB family chromosome partitioning protein
MERKVLGKGLGALIPDTVKPLLEKEDKIVNLDISQIKPSTFQPRAHFDPHQLKELTDSIKEKGVVQPILVRPTESGYELVAGERRLRAVRNLGFDKIPAIVKTVTNEEALELSLIENIQRQDLNPIEEAQAYKRLAEEFNLTQEQIAQAVGKDRVTITNILRLLKLPDKIQKYLISREITMGHARAILALPTAEEQLKFCQKIITQGLSVREVENLAKRETTVKSHKRKLPAKDHHLIALEEELQRVLGTKVRIHHKQKRGTIVIEYYSHADMERILHILKVKKF